VKIKKQHLLTGEYHEIEVPVTPEQLSRWYNGELIQHAMPNISAEDRKFLLTGLLPGEYDALFPDV
jgi:hypothetical protein